jgi:hypothetical protein
MEKQFIGALGREQAIDDKIARLRAIDASEPITDEQLAKISRNTIALYHRPSNLRIGEFKQSLLAGRVI